MNFLRAFRPKPILAIVQQNNQHLIRWKQRRPEISRMSVGLFTFGTLYFLFVDPTSWYDSYPIALVGKYQSPINIDTGKCIHNRDRLSPLILHYPLQFHNLRIRNPKDEIYFGWRVDVPYNSGDQTSECLFRLLIHLTIPVALTGGPLDHRYKLVQFHAHWGQNCICGSEHTINGHSFSAELHFVHWNSDLFETPRKASLAKRGLAVVAVFLDAVDDDIPLERNETMSTICNLMSSIKYKNTIRKIERPLNVLELLPENRSYWTYEGSLTTPPLWETVTWIVFEEPIKCTKSQVSHLLSTIQTSFCFCFIVGTVSKHPLLYQRTIGGSGGHVWLERKGKLPPTTATEQSANSVCGTAWLVSVTKLFIFNL